MEDERADHEVQRAATGRRRSGPPASTAAAVDGAAEIVVTGRPMKSRSLDGFQFQYRQRGGRGQPARGRASSRRSADEPPRSWYERSGVSTSVTRSNALKLGAV